jgi:hypothetical protein
MEYNYSANRYEPVERKAAAIPVPGLVLVGERGATVFITQGRDKPCSPTPHPSRQSRREETSQDSWPLGRLDPPATELGPDSKLCNAVRKVYQEAGYYS